MKGEEISGAPVPVIFAVYLPAYFDYEYIYKSYSQRQSTAGKTQKPCVAPDESTTLMFTSNRS
jgi:hypothetical protein